MKRVFFEPWVGGNYNTGGIFNKKILVLGESHYCANPECKNKCGFKDFPDGGCEDFTQNTVHDYLDPKKERNTWMPTYLKFERSLVGDYTTPEKSKEIWNSIAFYNYLQVALTEARKAGSKEDYEDSKEPFFEVINKLQPDLIIIWGVRLFYKLPEEGWTEGDPLIIDGYDVKNGYYQLNNGNKVRCIAVYHPSTGYSWDWWYKVISSQL